MILLKIFLFFLQFIFQLLFLNLLKRTFNIWAFNRWAFDSRAFDTLAFTNWAFVSRTFNSWRGSLNFFTFLTFIFIRIVIMYDFTYSLNLLFSYFIIGYFMFRIFYFILLFLLILIYFILLFYILLLTFFYIIFINLFRFFIFFIFFFNFYYFWNPSAQNIWSINRSWISLVSLYFWRTSKKSRHLWAGYLFIIWRLISYVFYIRTLIKLLGVFFSFRFYIFILLHNFRLYNVLILFLQVLILFNIN